MGATLGLAGVLCVETPGEVTTDVEAALVETGCPESQCQVSLWSPMPAVTARHGRNTRQQHSAPERQ